MTPNRSTGRFFTSLDGIRGVASLQIVLRHTEPFFGITSFRQSYLAVDIFFVLSGVVIANAYERRLQSGLSWLEFAWIRLVRIYPLYLAGIFLAFAAALVAGGRHFDAPMFFRLLLFALLILPFPRARTNSSGSVFPLDVPAWSLFLELGVNIIYARCIEILSNRALVVIMTASAAGLVAALHFFAPGNDLNIGWNRATLFGGCLRVGYSFFAGVLLYRIFSAKPANAGARLSSAILPWAILLAVGVILMASPSGAWVPYFDFIAVVLVFPALTYLALHVNPSGLSERIFKFLGGVSYAVYVIHQPLGQLVQGLMERTGRIKVAAFAPWGGVAFLALLLVVCWILDKVYDTPVRKFLLRYFAGVLARARERLEPARARSEFLIKNAFSYLISGSGKILAALWLLATILDIRLFFF